MVGLINISPVRSRLNFGASLIFCLIVFCDSYWNRDIRQLIDESGLVVDEFSEFHCGTGCVAVARKKH